MNKLYEKSIRTLELPSILKMLSQKAVCDVAKERSLEIKPTDDLLDAQKLMDETAAAVKMIELHGKPPFSSSVKDLGGSVRRAELGGTLSMPELLSVASLLTTTGRVKSYLQEDSEGTCLDYKFFRLTPNKYLEDKITTSIISEEEMADNASSELYTIRRKIRVANSKVRDTLQRIISSQAYSKFLQEAIVTQRGGRFVVPVKSEHKGNLPGMVHDVSSSGATFFIEPMQVVQLNNEVRELLVDEKKEIERILAELSADVADHAEGITENFTVLAGLDLIFAKGKLAYDMRAIQPEIRDTGAVYFRNARHPLLDKNTVVPISVSLGESFDTLVVTGPNTGGKTVALKTIGLLTVMASCGLFIPADDGSYVSVFSGIYADIGDEQSIEQSLSTFSSHMTNIVSVLEAADHRSVVLFDELGAGTDPTEGAALAVSIIENTRAKGAKIAATTHYAEIKEYALTTPGVENASCEFDVETLRPTFRLLIGIPGKSNAFAISKRLGLSDEIIEGARQRMSYENRQFEDVVTTLENERRLLERQRSDAEKFRREAEQTALRARKLQEEIDRERNTAKERATKEAQAIIADARREVDSILIELNELRKRTQDEKFVDDLNRARSDFRGRLNTSQSKLKPETKRAVGKKPNRPLVPGDIVRLINLGTEGTVLSPPDANGNLSIQAGILKVTLKLSEVELVERDYAAEAVKKYAKTLPQKSSASESERTGGGVRSASTEVDLRGMATDEAILKMERFIDGAMLSNLNTVTIIHGKGTGALRSAVQQRLRSYRGIKSFRLGKYGEGEDGVTIVEL